MSLVGPRFGYVEMGYRLTKKITRGNRMIVPESWGWNKQALKYHKNISYAKMICGK